MSDEVTITAYELALQLGGDKDHEQAVLAATLNLGLSFLKLNRAECERALDWIADNDATVGRVARYARPKLALVFAEKGWTTTMGGAARPTPLRVPSVDELKSPNGSVEDRLAPTTRTGEFRRSDYRRSSSKRYRRTQVIGLMVEAGLYQAEAEVLVDEAVRALLGDSSASSMDAAVLEQVLQKIEKSDARMRSYMNHVRNALALASAVSG